MTSLLEEAVEVLRGLPDDRQEAAARAIINYGSDDDDAQLSDEQVAEIERRTEPEIFNTDQGSQFTCAAFTDVLHKSAIRISMDGKELGGTTCSSSGCGGQ